MGFLVSGIAPLGLVSVLATLDLGGYLVGSEMAAMIAGLFSAFFSGLANVFIGTLFNGGS